MKKKSSLNQKNCGSESADPVATSVPYGSPTSLSNSVVEELFDTPDSTTNNNENGSDVANDSVIGEYNSWLYWRIQVPQLDQVTLHK